MKLPKITNKQQDIIKLLYRYRFLNRIQIQLLMNHKDKRRTISWLKDLRDKDYVNWIYSTDFTEKSKPAIYYIGINGVRYLKTVKWDNDGTLAPFYPLEEVRKCYKDNERSQTFIERSILIADCCLTLEAINATDSGVGNNGTKSNVSYTYLTEADYIDPDSEYYFLAEHETLRPNLLIIKQKGRTTTNYLLEVFDSTLPRYRLRYRLKAYFTYIDDGEWEYATGDDSPPTVLLVCPNLVDLIYAKRRTKKLITGIYDDEAPENIHIRFTMTEKLQEHGVTAEIWEEGRQALSL
ncbi:MAG TPA: replication-relaxation family protein [Candidatus Saccharimonadales bacterium]|nr:replication-relaxation family protein [Candidatus Saccharimonadales bacterium]